MGSLKYPPCSQSPITEKPYPRHKWEIHEGAPVIVREAKTGPIYYYRVRCSRCGLNDPKPPTH